MKPDFQYISEVIDDKGLKRYKVAKDVGVSANHLNRVLRGDSPLLKTLRLALCLVLDIDEKIFADSDFNSVQKHTA